MSFEIPGRLGTRCRTSGSARCDCPGIRTSGFTSTSPETAVPRCAARWSESAPPMDRPQTKTCSHSFASRSNSRSTVAYQSGQRVALRSRQWVPCPGSSGSETL